MYESDPYIGYLNSWICKRRMKYVEVGFTTCHIKTTMLKVIEKTFKIVMLPNLW